MIRKGKYSRVRRREKVEIVVWSENVILTNNSSFFFFWWGGIRTKNIIKKMAKAPTKQQKTIFLKTSII